MTDFTVQIDSDGGATTDEHDDGTLANRRLSRRQTMLGIMSTTVLGSTLLSACGDDGQNATSTATSDVRLSLTAGAAAASTVAPTHPLLRGGDDAFLTLMRYDPAADPDAPYFRSTVPLATRIAALAATQAHPALDPRSGTATLATTYRTIERSAPDVWRAVRHGAMPAGGVQVPRRLGTNDVVVQWSGTGIIPNPAMTDTAHRNGAPCLGTIWQPDRRMFDGSVFPVEQVARKLVALTRYFGFEGYFINHELGSGSDKDAVTVLVSTMRAIAAQEGLTRFHIQRYDGHTSVADLFASPAAGGQRANSIMPDQGWSGYGGPGNCCSGWSIDPVQVSNEVAQYGRTPFDVYYGFQLYPGPGYINVAAPAVISPNDGQKVLGGLQLYSLDDGYLNTYRARREGKGAQYLPAAATIPDIEQLVYSGQTLNPALNNTPTAAQQALYDQPRYYSESATTVGIPPNGLPDQANLPIAYGVANFITERSVIGAMPFVTHFNVGDGQRFFVDGRQVADTAWFNLGIQDVLPTWQWWRAPYAGLTDREREAPNLLEVEYDGTSAYDGGTSLRVSGALGTGNATRVHLYKTDILVPSSGGAPAVEVVTRGTATDRARTQIGLIFADRPGNVEWLQLDAGTALGGSDWRANRLDLSPFRNRRIASVLLGFKPVGNAATAAFDLRFGRLALVDGSTAVPRAPAGLVLDRRVVDATSGAVGIGVRWRGAGRHDVFSIDAQSGARRWIGRVDGDSFYSATALPAGAGTTTIEVQAVAAGMRGGAARLRV